GNYQKKNICTVFQSIEIIKNFFPLIDKKSIVKGLQNVSKNTGLKGRWQILNKSPLIIVDVAHNEAGIKYVMEQLETIIIGHYHDQIENANRQEPLNLRSLHIVFGLVNDKDPLSILSLFPKHAHYYFCKANIP